MSRVSTSSIDESAERPSFSVALFGPLRWVRWLALLAIVAALVSRGLAPALQSFAPHALIAVVGRAGSWLSQALLFAQVGTLIAVTMSVLRLPLLPLGYRLVATALAGIVLGLVVPASGARLAPEFSALLSVATILAVLAGASQALMSAPVRVLGLLLGLSALGALTRQTAWLLSLLHRGTSMMAAGRVAALVAFVLHGLLVTCALLWLATRRRRLLSFSTTLCSALALVVSWFSELLARGDIAAWKAVLARSALFQLTAPAPPVPQGMRVFLVSLSLLLGGLALLNRREAPVVVGALTLTLAAGIDFDVPLCALSATTASLVASLAAHDPLARPS